MGICVCYWRNIQVYIIFKIKIKLSSKMHITVLNIKQKTSWFNHKMYRFDFAPTPLPAEKYTEPQKGIKKCPNLSFIPKRNVAYVYCQTILFTLLDWNVITLLNVLKISLISVDKNWRENGRIRWERPFFSNKLIYLILTNHLLHKEALWSQLKPLFGVKGVEPEEEQTWEVP